MRAFRKLDAIHDRAIFRRPSVTSFTLGEDERRRIDRSSQPAEELKRIVLERRAK